LIEAPGQGHLFEIDALGDVAPLPEPEPPARAPGTAPRSRRSRRPDYDQLPQVRIEHDVPEAEKVCSHCGEAKARIGEDEARVLEFIPARFELHVHVLPKYACSHCRDGVVAPETPPRPLSGCIAGAGVLAEVVVSKFAEHLPLYRFEDISTRYGLHLSRSTLCDWVGGVADLLRPLYELDKELVRTSPVIWTDDTHVTVLGGDTPGSHRGQFWVYIGSAAVPYDVYDFTENRKRDGPVQFLAGYAGYLQADAFSGYDGIYAGSDGGIREVFTAKCRLREPPSSRARGSGNLRAGPSRPRPVGPPAGGSGFARRITMSIIRDTPAPPRPSRRLPARTIHS
ncbi:MAG TPA: IS66 family transposase, partial [Isosphaeraceae bacterium]|nr:IS66 family transposase [Isosphaeraceae bacterium]